MLHATPDMQRAMSHATSSVSSCVMHRVALACQYLCLCAQDATRRSVPGSCRACAAAPSAARPKRQASHCSYSACDRSLGRFLCAAQSRSTLRSARRCRRRMRFRRLCCAASISAEHPQRYVSKARPHARKCACVCTRVRERARVLRARARVWSGRRAGGRAGNAG